MRLGMPPCPQLCLSSRRRRAIRRALLALILAGLHGTPADAAGYPSNLGFQYDPAHRDGEIGQARYLGAAVPAAWRAGAAAVFVTARDTDDFGEGGPVAGEGVLRWPSLAARPAARVLRRLAGAPRAAIALGRS